MTILEQLLSEDIVITHCVDPTEGVAAATDLNGAEVDMSGFEGVMFVCVVGAITAGAVTALKAQQDTVTGMGSAADLLGTSITIADSDDDQVFVLDIYKPEEQFLRPVIERATQNAVVASCIAIQYKSKEQPTTINVTDEVTVEKHVSPIEGTA